MTERQRSLVLLAVIVVGCVAIIRANADVPFQLVLLVVVLVRVLLGTYRAREGRNALSQMLATLRSQDRAGRQAILDRIPSPPAWITQNDAGAGFAEIAGALLANR